MTTLPGQQGESGVSPAEPVETWVTEMGAGLLDGPDAHAYEGPSIEPLAEVCPRFTLDYVTNPELRHRPEHRYCHCGWTEAHHLQAEENDGPGLGDTITGQGVL